MFDPARLDAGLRAPADALLARIEEAGLNASQPPEQLLIDGWLLRFSPGTARRARSVNAVAAGRLPLDEKLALCRRWFERFRLPLLFRVTPFSQPAALDEFLAAAGFVAFDETRVMVCPQVDRGSADGADVTSKVTSEVDSDAFAQVVGALRGSSMTQIEAHARRMRLSPLTAFSVRMVTYLQQGHAVAAGQVVVEGDLAGIYDIVTAPAERGRGHGRAISQRLLATARTMRAHTAYLQVDAGNTPARSLYTALGFADRYAYWYRRPSGTVDGMVV